MNVDLGPSGTTGISPQAGIDGDRPNRQAKGRTAAACAAARRKRRVAAAPSPDLR